MVSRKAFEKREVSTKISKDYQGFGNFFLGKPTQNELRALNLSSSYARATHKEGGTWIWDSNLIQKLFSKAIILQQEEVDIRLTKSVEKGSGTFHPKDISP